MFVLPQMQQSIYPAFDYGSPQLNFRPLKNPFSAIGDFVVDNEMLLLEASDALVEIVVGFLKGFVQRNNLTKVSACIDDIDDIIQEVQDIIDEFKSLQPTQIVDAIRKAIKIVQDGLSDVDTCKQTNTDLQKVEEWAKNVVTHPDDIVNHVLANLGDIVSEISKTISDSGAQEYRTVGDDMAAVVADIFGTCDEKFSAQSIDWDLIY